MADERLGASFSIDVTKLKAGLAQANRLIRESESEFKSASAGMDDFTQSQEGLEAKIKSLNRIQEIQEEKVRALKEQYDDLVSQGVDPTSAQMVKLRTDINNASAAVSKTKKETEKYEKALEDVGESLEDVAEEVEESKDKFGALDVAVGNLAANLVSSLGSAIKDSISALMNLSAETQEYREDIGKLKTAFESAGQSTETATKLYKGFYTVLGEEDRSVEAVNHLAKFVQTEKDFATWTDIATGVWGTFGDSLPIEGLTEASNETAKVGKLTGVLADALNWAGVNEDDFQASLDKCSTEQERQALITRTLNKLYKGAADNYKKNNKSVIDARKVTSDYTDTMADLGEEMEPVNTAITEMKSEFAKGLAPVVKKDVIPVINDFMDEMKEDGTIEKFTDGVSSLAKTVLPPFVKVVKFAAENIETLVGVTLTAIGAYKTFKATMAISGVINTTRAAIQGMSGAISIATKMQLGLNTAMKANVFGAVLTAVSFLIGGLVTLAQKTKETQKVNDGLTESQRKFVQAAKEAAKEHDELAKSSDKASASAAAQMDYVQDLWEELETLADKSGKVKDLDKARAEFIIGELNDALGTEYEMNGNIIKSYENIKKSIEDVIQTKKAQIMLEANEEKYKDAINKVADAEKARNSNLKTYAEAKNAYAEEEKKYAAAMKEADETAKLGSNNAISNAENIRTKARIALNTAKETYDAAKTTYEQSNATVKGYYEDIDQYQIASTQILKGETDKAISTLTKYGNGFKTAKDVVGKSTKEQQKIMKQQVIDTQTNLAILEDDYEKSQGNMTKEEKKQAQERIKQARQEAEDAKTEYAAVGGNLVGGLVKGVEEGKWDLSNSLKGVINNGLKAIGIEFQIKSPSRVFKKKIGKWIPLGIAAGIDSETKSVVKSVLKQSKAIEDAYYMPDVSAKVETGFVNKNKSGATGSNVKTVVVNQTNNYSQAHSRYELYKVKQQTTAALNLALQGV